MKESEIIIAKYYRGFRVSKTTATCLTNNLTPLWFVVEKSCYPILKSSRVRKKYLNFSLPIEQLSLKYCLPWISLIFLF